MATKQYLEAVKAVEAWCKKRKINLIRKPRHVHPRAHVVGHTAPGCLIISKCWVDSEPHTQEWDKKYPCASVNLFDDSLKAGDWCITAYISTFSYGQTVAIPIPERK
jgi:hypothetical protein